jgi:hypothetical protein
MEDRPDKDEQEQTYVDFLQLPTEIHEQVIRRCSVNEVHSLALVNHLLHNVVRSKLRDFLIAACQNGTS